MGPDAGEKEASPRVSFVIGNYNGVGVLPECMDSVLAQTIQDFEIIVVDDASTDASAVLLRERYPQSTLLVNDKNRGLPYSLNRGYEAAAGEWIAFLNNDVVLEREWLESMLEAAETWSGAVLFGSRLLFYDDPGVINSTGGMMNLAGYAWDRDIYGSRGEAAGSPYIFYPCGAAMLAKRSFLEEAGPFDDTLRAYYEDVELGWRAHLLGYRAIYVPRAAAYHHFSLSMGAFPSRKVYLAERNRIRLMAKYFQAETISSCLWVWLRLYLLRLRDFWRDPERGWRERAGLSWRMVQAVAWNLLHLRSLWRERRRWKGLRKRSDDELIGDPLVGLLEIPPARPSPLLRDYRPLGPGEITVFRRRISMGPGDEMNLGPGWHRRETAPDGTHFRWTQEKAVLYLRPRKGVGRLRMVIYYGHPREASELSLYINGVRIGEMTLSGYPVAGEWCLPGTVQGLLEVTLEVGNPFTVPREGGEAVKGVAVARVEVR